MQYSRKAKVKITKSQQEERKRIMSQKGRIPNYHRLFNKYFYWLISPPGDCFVFIPMIGDTNIFSPHEIRALENILKTAGRMKLKDPKRKSLF